MTSQTAAVEAVAQRYMDGLYAGDVEALAEIFHPSSHLYSVGPDGALADWPRERWFEIVKGRASGKSRGLARNDRIVSIDLGGAELAFVKVETSLHPRYFTDYLTMLRFPEGWRIVAKTFRYDDRT